MRRRLIVVDSSHPLGRENRCFDPVHEFSGAGHAIQVHLAREAKKRGLDVITADVYLAMGKTPNYAAALTVMVTPRTDKLLSSGVMPTICMSLESPLNSKKYHHNIRHYAGRFNHSYQFRGTQERLVGTNTVFHPIVFPVETKESFPLKQWDKRKYLTLVNSNKRSVYQNWRSIRESARSILSRMRALYYYLVDPWMRVREAYKDRVQAIKYFSAHSEFELYGYGWDQPIRGYGEDYHHAALKVYKGEIPGGLRKKREVMSRYKYALCFENCLFPGYVTEKIFDCFLAGCIPVYLGAPDIIDFVPKGSFIDVRDFGDYAELDKYLRQMPEKEALQYIDTARYFLNSAVFDKFTVDYFVNDILDVIEEELQSQ